MVIYLWGLSSWVEVGESPKQELDSSVTELSSECASVQNLGCFILGTQNSHIMDRTECLGGCYGKLEQPYFEI